MGKFISAIKAVIHGVERRPWIPMAAYLACFALFVLVAWMPFANLIDSRWRPLPELSSSAKLMIGEIVNWIYRLLYVAGVFSVVVVPFVMLCAMRFKSAFYTLVMGMVGVSVSAFFLLVTAPIWFVLGLEDLSARQGTGRDKTVKVYEDYVSASKVSKDLGKIIPPGATDIMVVHQVYFQGYSDNFRCRITKEDLMKFAAERKYAFKEYDLVDDIGTAWCFHWHEADDALFSQFPVVIGGQAVDHHSDGFMSCYANCRVQGGNPDERSVIYVYDARCSILWAQCFW